MTIVLGGAAVPAASLVDEKQKRTLRALTITPTTIGEVLVSKGLVGVIVSVVMALLVLIFNDAFGGEPLLLLVTLLLSAAFSAALGVLIGALAKNLDTLFAVLKATGVLLYAPAFIFLFPQVPQWIARLFPTYYMVKPVIDISQFGASFSDVAPDLGILVALLVATVAVVVAIVRRPDGKLSLQY
jgi:ABC-2 type transport system permease protein